EENRDADPAGSGDRRPHRHGMGAAAARPAAAGSALARADPAGDHGFAPDGEQRGRDHGSRARDSGRRVAGLGLSAAGRSRAADREQSEFVRTEFERDIDSVSLYDMTLSTDTLGVQASAAAIAAAARARFNF